MEGQQLPWVTLADAHVWPNLEHAFPGIIEVFKRLAGTMKTIFNRNIDLVDRSIAVYSTGRLRQRLTVIGQITSHKRPYRR